MDTPKTILPRYYYGGYGYCSGDNCNGAWETWGRWVLLGCLVAAALAVFFLVSCLSARRRRKHGYSPYRGTGWTLGRTPPGHAPATYSGATAPQYGNQQPYYNNSNNPAPPPVYSPAPNTTYYGNNNGIELQQPQATYGGDGHYAPPKDPPPAKRSEN